MPKMIFVRLPVTNLEASMTFYKSLGFQTMLISPTIRRRAWCVQ
jgi:predicted lactoylglutathione lyase